MYPKNIKNNKLYIRGFILSNFTGRVKFIEVWSKSPLFSISKLKTYIYILTKKKRVLNKINTLWDRSLKWIRRLSFNWRT